MNSFYPEDELNQLGLKDCGRNVLISRKTSIYGAENIKVGNNVRIDDFCILSGNIVIGDFVHIAAYTALYGGDKGIIIDDYAGLSSRISVYSQNDDYSGETMTNPMIPNEYRNVTSEKVIISKHAIIGSGCIILPGVTLKEGSAFAALSLINRDANQWSVNAGIPFKEIKKRSRNLLDLEKKFTQGSDSDDGK